MQPMALEINSDEIHTQPVASATVMVLRDSPDGIEVLMVRRHSNSGVLGGVHVFPGGKLDAQDCEVDTHGLDQPLQHLHQTLNQPGLDPATAAGLHVAALRETFEECGLLLGLDVPPDVLTQAQDGLAAGLGFTAMLRRLDLPLATAALTPWSRWVTPRVPSVSNKRFDTRFFVARMPVGQEARHDNHEATEAVWLQPRAGLHQYWEGRIDLAPPQIMSLSHLARFGSVAELLATARRQVPGLIEPEPFDQDGQRVICYPGDARHSQPEAIWPGPTRLTWRNRRFEPEGGLTALLP